ncbi:MAG: organic hydroperoxide resistance protein [Bacteroidales bacterium]
MKTLYEAKATAKGGRNGKVESNDGLISMTTRVPKSMGGEGGNYTNPEQLFAATFSTCYNGALDLVIEQEGVETGQTSVTATIGIGKQKDGLGINAVLEANIPGVDKETGMKLMEKAHQVCPYSKATRGNIDVELRLAE